MDTCATRAFERRTCPDCGSAHYRTLLDLTPETIVKSNWTYCPDSMHRLGIPPRQHFPIDECVSCGFIYAGLLPAPAFLAQVYDGLIDTDAARRANLSRASLARKMGDLSLLFQLFADSVRPVRLLDYGCGFGPVLELLRCLPDIHGIGYETSAARLQELRNRGLSATGELDHVAREAPFDVVLLDNVLEHLPQPRHALEFVRGVCANGAVVYISVPAIDGRVIAGQRQAAKAGGRVLMDINPWEHLNYFNLRSLDKLLDEFGFRPLAPTSFPNEINIGLRGSPERTSRLKNGLASFGRLCRFVWRGEGISTVNRRFYRLEA